MLNRNFLLLALVLVLGSFLVAFSNAKTESKGLYEYVTIAQINPGEVVISEQGKDLRIVKVETKPKSSYDFRTIYTEVNKYEMEGWELFDTNTAVNTAFYVNSFLLRRKKQ